jgi:hypothetical protein
MSITINSLGTNTINNGMEILPRGFHHLSGLSINQIDDENPDAGPYTYNYGINYLNFVINQETEITLPNAIKNSIVIHVQTNSNNSNIIFECNGTDKFTENSVIDNFVNPEYRIEKSFLNENKLSINLGLFNKLYFICVTDGLWELSYDTFNLHSNSNFFFF